VVSGDVIHGVEMDSANAEEELAAQYEEALNFLGRLSDIFVQGDKHKVCSTRQS